MTRFNIYKLSFHVLDFLVETPPPQTPLRQLTIESHSFA